MALNANMTVVNEDLIVALGRVVDKPFVTYYSEK